MDGENKTLPENKQSGVITDTAEAEKIKAGENNEDLDLGKFRTPRELQSAYTALEKEFTRKCQELSEIKKKTESAKTGNSDSTGIAVTDAADREQKNVYGQSTEPIDERSVLKAAVNNKMVREIIIAQYLKSVKTNSARLIGDANGTFVITPPKRPKTIEDAGNLVKKIFDN